MSGAFDAFLYVPATPPATPSPTKKQPRATPAFLAPRLADLASPQLGRTDVVEQERKRKREPDVCLSSPGPESVRRRSPRLKSSLIASPPPSPDPSVSPSASASETLKKKKRRKAARPYADPALYAHLPQHLSDVIEEDLTLLMVGLNPGVMTAQTGHHFANPTNLFWPLLFSSGIITDPLKARDSELLPRRYGVGITNIVGRPTAEGGELSKDECVAGATRLMGLVRRYRPRAIALTGKGIWDAMFKAIHGRAIRKSDAFAFGWQQERIVDDHDGWSCPIFVTMGTSGRVAAYSPAYKREVFARLGDWVKGERHKMVKLSSEISDDVKAKVKESVVHGDDEVRDTETLVGVEASQGVKVEEQE
ncbi:Uracil DNA glycosylase superfamily protein [Taphrina deformans PYCC 5710]|uniref:Uracil DNA glycosylase superfamily protein n=1 Tax=Taphrina deformans (strain PYCC 5710 / ATCC 11124 / CBS 356.35 / IMI 108563 / JCM 9778 / NBRC 8474) TaxID=1097556 RepID=R4XDD9_TAPDE|nr:Uracil DNA glycosylase superfamily protein [Taphrina deformans PYCC 5710]|eukprot:CCG82423.1 Uracil DNA glycosylase superfamily protein [Taphrina deformans PYCC 5710]